MRKENHPSWLVPFDIAKQLKEIGFNENTLFYRLSGDTDLKLSVADDVSLDYTLTVEDVEQFNYNRRGFYLSIPTWEQVFEWFRAKGFHGVVEYEGSGIFTFRYIIMGTPSAASSRKKYFSYNEARKQLLIELVKVYKIGCPKLH